MIHVSIWPFVTTLVLVLGLLNAQEASTASTADLYRRLTNLDPQLSGLGPEQSAALRGIKRDFRNTGEAGCNFVISKLDEMNGRLNSLARSTDDWESDLVLDEINKNSFVKCQLFDVLVDFYPVVNSKVGREILRTLKESHNPIATWNGEGQQMDRALLRIGKDGIDVFLDLARSTNERVRCSAYESLNAITEFANDASTSAPRNLSCRAELEIRNHDLENWKGWWLVSKDKPVLPKVDGPQRP